MSKWRVVDPHYESRNIQYVTTIVESLKAVPRDKKPASNIQSASTQRILERDPAQDEAWFNRPNPANWKGSDAVIEAANLLHNQFPENALIAEDLRRRSKNTIGDAISTGASAFSKERRELAEEAFMYSPGTSFTELTQDEKNRIQALTPYSPSTQPPAEPPKIPWYKRLFKIRSMKWFSADKGFHTERYDD